MAHSSKTRLRPTHPRRATSAFTLLELVVVLGILAVLTTLATRSLVQVEDQHRYDASQRSLAEIETAVLGDPNERASDGTHTVSGFVADLGRLPRTVLNNNDSLLTLLTLQELWQPSGLAPFDARPATTTQGVPSGDEDAEVLVAAGWRGPYLRLPFGAAGPVDGWGNAYTSLSAANPADPTGAGYARLRGAGDVPLNQEGKPIVIVRHLGSNSVFSEDDKDAEQDFAITFAGRVDAQLKTSVQVRDKNGPAPGAGTDQVIVRVFTPDPENASRIVVHKSSETLLTTPVSVPAPSSSSPQISGLTVGRRPVRAYLTKADGTFIAKSSVKYVDFQPGVNFVDLTIVRPTVASSTP